MPPSMETSWVVRSLMPLNINAVRSGAFYVECVLDPRRCRFGTDQDRRLIAVDFYGHVVRRPIPRFHTSAGTRVDQPVLRRPPTVRVEEHPRPAVLGVAEIEDTGIEKTARVPRHIPTRAGLSNR